MRPNQVKFDPIHRKRPKYTRLAHNRSRRHNRCPKQNNQNARVGKRHFFRRSLAFLNVDEFKANPLIN